MAKNGRHAGWPKGTPRPAHLKTQHAEFMRALWQDPQYREKTLPKLLVNSALSPMRQPKDRLKKHYGLTKTEVTEIRARACEVCGTTSGPSDVDHNHETNQVRGALCGNCNRVLGLMREDVGLILKLADYIAKYEWKLTDIFSKENVNG